MCTFCFCYPPYWARTIKKTNFDLWLEEWRGGSFPAKLIKLLILAAPMVGLFFSPHFHLVKQSPYHRLSACGESAYLHEPAEWSQLPQEWSPDKDDPRGHRLQTSLPLDSHTPHLLATTINNPLFFLFFPKHLSLSLPVSLASAFYEAVVKQRDRLNGAF